MTLTKWICTAALMQFVLSCNSVGGSGAIESSTAGDSAAPTDSPGTDATAAGVSSAKRDPSDALSDSPGTPRNDGAGVVETDGSSGSTDTAPGSDAVGVGRVVPPDTLADEATCDSDDWSSRAIENWIRPNDPPDFSPLPDPQNNCLPEGFVTECTNTCDCKVVVYGCHPVGVSVEVPWNQAIWYDMDSDGQCVHNTCGGTEAPPNGAVLLCASGKCTIAVPD